MTNESGGTTYETLVMRVEEQPLVEELRKKYVIISTDSGMTKKSSLRNGVILRG